jgi:hypothetical protein
MSQPEAPCPEGGSARDRKSWSAAVRELHGLYCQWTAQPLSLHFDRQRLWYEFLRAGFSAADLKQVVSYLQKEIGAQRRNVGALKLSNLLQLDRFEEDLHISRVRLKPPVQRLQPAPVPPPSPAIDEVPRTRLLEEFRRFRQQLRRGETS